MSIRVSEEELDKLKEVTRIEVYASYSEFVRRTALHEANRIVNRKKRAVIRRRHSYKNDNN